MNKSQMNTISGGMRSFIIICIASVCLSISAANAPRNNVEIILQVEPSLACVPQEVYLHALIESESEILDSAQIDNNHRTIRLSGVVPYQTNVILTFSKTNLDAEVVVTPGDRIWLTLGEEDADYYHCVKDAKGSKAHSEYVQFMNYIKNYNIRKARYQDTQLITKLDSISRESISDILRKQQQQYIDYMLKTSKSKYPFLVWYANVLLRKLLPQKEARNLLNNAISRFPAYLPFNQLRPGYVAPEESRKSKVITEKIWRIQTKRMKIKPNTSAIVKAPQIGEELPMLLHREDGRMTSLLVFSGKVRISTFDQLRFCLEFRFGHVGAPRSVRHCQNAVLDKAEQRFKETFFSAYFSAFFPSFFPAFGSGVISDSLDCFTHVNRLLSVVVVQI